MAFQTPKTDWTTNTGIDYVALNRIESNIEYLYGIKGKKKGFDAYVLSGNDGVGLKPIKGGILDSTGNSYLEKTDEDYWNKKITSAWEVGSVNKGAFPSAGSSGLTLTDDTWYNFFVIGKSSDPTDTDFGFDENNDASVLLNGDNAGGAGFDLYRRLFSVYYYDVTDKILPFKYCNGRYYLSAYPAYQFINYDDLSFTIASGFDTDSISFLIPKRNNIFYNDDFLNIKINLWVMTASDPSLSFFPPSSNGIYGGRNYALVNQNIVQEYAMSQQINGYSESFRAEGTNGWTATMRAYIHSWEEWN